MKHHICIVTGCPIPTNSFFCDGHRAMFIDWKRQELRARKKADDIHKMRTANLNLWR